jgi:hypothetical protein
MPNNAMHRKRGSGAAVAEYLWVCQQRGREPNLLNALVVAYLGGIAATLPDRIDDSAAGPNHRGIAHSQELYLFLRCSVSGHVAAFVIRTYVRY